jgi:hypothetical protein
MMQLNPFNMSSLRFICLLLFLSRILLVTEKSEAQIIINEVMSTNFNLISDEDGAFEDWIEIRNTSAEPVNLIGYGLSDDALNLRKWIFPEYILPSGAVLMVWASGKDRRPVTGEMSNGIERHFFADIEGSAVQDLLNHSSFPDNPTSKSILTGLLEGPSDIGDNYGQLLFTQLIPPQTGEFVFQITSDDNSHLYLSTDASPENAVLIAEVPDWTRPWEWEKYPEQTSNPVFLQAGQEYHLKILMKEAGGADNVAVRWQMPDGTMEEPLSAAHCFIESSFLHSSFSINNDVESLILTNPSGVIIDEMMPVDIPLNKSYGRTSGNSIEWVFFEHPTPGSHNTNTGFSELTPNPSLSPASGIFDEPVLVTLTSADPNAQIWYTYDGSEPSENNGNLYSAPFYVNSTMYVRARAFSPGKMGSGIIAGTWSVVHDDLIDFSSNLPLMVIHQFNQEIEPGERSVAYMNLIGNDDAELRTELNAHASFSGRITANVRGSSSQMFPKKGYGFHTLEEDGTNRKVSLLGMPEEHNWILHGPYTDKTLIRNAISYSIGEQLGGYTPRTRFVELFMHSGNDKLQPDDYRGIYLLKERIKIAPGRVNIHELELHHNQYPEVSGGYIFSIDRLNEGERGFLTARESEFRFVRPDEYSVTPAQKQYLISFVDSLETVLFSDNFADPNTGYVAFMDPASFIDVHLITELLKEIDGFRLSFFYHKDRQGKLKAGPIWDYNLALGNANYLNVWDPQGWYYSLLNPDEYAWRWYSRLFDDPEFMKQYKKRYRVLRSSAFSDINLMNHIHHYVNLLSEAQLRDQQKWNTLGMWVWPNWFVGNTYKEEVDWMTDWLKQRVQWMDEQLGEPYSLIHYWNFNDKDYLATSYTVGGANISFTEGADVEIIVDDGQDFSGLNARNGDPAGNHLRVNNPLNAEVVFQIPSTNYHNLIFSYETRRSGSGANRQFVSYTVDGELFIPIDTLVVTETPTLYSFDFDAIADTDNQALLAVKILFGFQESEDGGSAGNNRFDNVTVDAEPANGVVQPPVIIDNLPDHFQAIALGEPLIINPGDYYSHPNGQSLQYSFTMGSTGVVSVSYSQDVIRILPMQAGGTEVQIEISDGVNPPLVDRFYVLVYPEAAVISDEPYIFNFWSADEPAGSFPDNMVFVQSNVDDPQLDTPLLFAYDIPVEEYHADDQGNIGFPYRNQSRTRINGLADNGVSFINTGRNRDLGAAILALDTRNVDEFNLSWKASTLLVNSRVYALSLQYRTNIEDPWKSWTDNQGVPVIYHRNESVGHSQSFWNLSLPNDATNKPYVQVRWIYHFTGQQIDPNVGARDMIGLNFISINHPLSAQQGRNHSLEPLLVFPNPVVEETIVFNKIVSGTLFDLQGRQVAIVRNGKTLDVSDILSGIYFFKSLQGEMIKIVVAGN